MRNLIGYYLVMFLLFVPLTQAMTTEKLPTDNLVKTHLKMVGEAQFSVLFWDIYYSRLYTPTGTFETVSTDTVFEIKYQRDISQVDLIDRTIEQWQHLDFPAAKYQAFVPKLAELWPDIKKGDTLALLVDQQSSYFYFNDQYLGKIEGELFAPLFLAIWISPKTSQPRLRQQLIGKKP